MDTQQISDLFMIFNVSGDGSMSKQEFVYCWNGWIKKVFLISLFTIIRILTVKCVRVLVSGLLITYWLLLVVDGYLCVMLHKYVNFYPGLGIIYFHFNVKGCQFIDRVTSIVITRVFVSATICQLNKAFLYCRTGSSGEKSAKSLSKLIHCKTVKPKVLLSKRQKRIISPKLCPNISSIHHQMIKLVFGRNFAIVREEVSLSISFSIK